MDPNSNGKSSVNSAELPRWYEKRLHELRAEFRQGEAHLAELERQRSQLRDTLLRISGAIQVLEEGMAAEMSHTVTPHAIGVDSVSTLREEQSFP